MATEMQQIDLIGLEVLQQFHNLGEFDDELMTDALKTAMKASKISFREYKMCKKGKALFLLGTSVKKCLHSQNNRIVNVNLIKMSLSLCCRSGGETGNVGVHV